MKKDFEGKVAFVTGAAVGIGRAIAVGFAENGADVIITDINEEKLNETKELVKAFGVKVKTAVFDIANETDVRNAVSESIEEFGKIDILVNNAGIYPHEEFLKSDSSHWKKIIDINILGTMYASQAVLPQMIEIGYGRIVNIGSVAGTYGMSVFVD